MEIKLPKNYKSINEKDMKNLNGGSDAGQLPGGTWWGYYTYERCTNILLENSQSGFMDLLFAATGLFGTVFEFFSGTSWNIHVDRCRQKFG
jgi:hypothetical protein